MIRRTDDPVFGESRIQGVQKETRVKADPD